MYQKANLFFFKLYKDLLYTLETEFEKQLDSNTSFYWQTI